MTRWLGAVVLDWLFIIILLLLLYYTPRPYTLVALPPVLVLLASRQHALLVLGHESVHFIVCRNKWLNDLFGDLLTFSPFGVSIASYRSFHTTHHACLGSPDDPERAGKVAFGRLGVHWDLPRSVPGFWLEVFLSLLGVRAYVMVLYAISFLPRTIKGITLLLSWWSVALLLFYYTGAWWVLGVWVWSMATTLWLSVWVRIWTEHTGINGTHRLSLTWWQEFFLLPHHIGYHYEHHERPTEPFHRLPALREELGGPAPITLGELMTSFSDGGTLYDS